MNFLAHAYLSFNQSEILTGNMISDFVKGRKQYDYSPMIQKGIKLHRAIDEYTDHHPATIAIKQLFRPAYRLYSGAFTDVAYDYFLANDINEFDTKETLNLFSIKSYQQIQENCENLPPLFQRIFPYMKEQNWLYNYRLTSGIQNSFRGLVNRASYMSESNTASSIFVNNLPFIESNYREFFPMLKTHAYNTLQDLIHAD